MSVADEIRKLADLKSEGLLTETEFEAQKAVLLEPDDEVSEAIPPKGQRASLLLRLLLGTAVLFGLIFALGWWEPGPEAIEKQRARDAIKLCWSETERKALSPGQQRFTAQTCEFMEGEFRKQYGHNP